jgi:hypothetical protein
MRNLLGNALLSFASIKAGLVAPGGSTGAVHDRSLMGLQILIERSLAEVRLDAGVQSLGPIAVHEILEDVAISTSLFAQSRGLRFVVISVGPSVFVAAD